MDDPAGEDDDYSDDDLDALPDHAFHELQQDAILSTQQPSLTELPTTEKPVGLTSDLGRLSANVPAGHAANQPALQAPSSDYGDFDEDMLDGEIFDAAEEPALAARYKASARGMEPGEHFQREQWRLQRHGANQRSSESIEAQQRLSRQGAFGLPVYNGSDSRGPNAPVQGGRAVHLVNQNRTGPPPEESADVNALQAQVQKVGSLGVQFQRIACLHFEYSC